ncbi:putative cysteine protease rd19b [Sarracenia purpurea var. burkii]
MGTTGRWVRSPINRRIEFPIGHPSLQTMDRRFSLLLVFSVLVATSLTAAAADDVNDDDLMIRQVESIVDQLLDSIDIRADLLTEFPFKLIHNMLNWNYCLAPWLKCDPEEPGSCDSGCNGGLMNSAFEYTLKAGGLMREEDYPYTGTDRGTCKFDKTKIAASVANFSVVSLDEDQIAANLVKNGPLAVAINAVFMQTYVGGVSCPYICSKRLDHGVLLVGYGSAGYSPIRMKEKPYWIIKNSWGESWGENGFYKICQGRNICGVDSMVSTVAAVHTTSQ